MNYPARTLLVQFLRATLGLTGTHVGCDTFQTGACTIDLNGRAADNLKSDVRASAEYRTHLVTVMAARAVAAAAKDGM